MANSSNTSVEPQTPTAATPRGEWLLSVLEGAVFPLTRSQLLQVAQENGATREQLTLLHRLSPQRSYLSAEDAAQLLR